MSDRRHDGGSPVGIDLALGRIDQWVRSGGERLARFAQRSRRSRRSFLKAMGVTAAALAGSGVLFDPDEALAAAAADDYNFNGCTHNLQGHFLNKSNVTIHDGSGQSLGLVINNKPNDSYPDGRLRFQGIEALTVGGRTYYYSWGAGGADGQSGHVWIADMQTRPTIDSTARGGSGGLWNGRTAPDTYLSNGTRKSYFVTPAAIPSAMGYIGPSTGLRHSFTHYGTPASPYSSGHTPLSWSWVNKTGGGIVRCQMKANDTFYPADVATININSIDSGGNVNGSVKAMYGSIWNGAQRIFGWTVHSHIYQGTYVPHIVCSNC